MDLDLKRKEIRKKFFSTGGLIIVSILGVFGVLLVYFSGIFNIDNLNTLYDCLSKNGILIIFGTFFFSVSLYCWILFFCNIILPPKKDVLYLCSKDNNEFYFLDKKGKSYDYDINKNNFEENCYYYVLKTRNYIYKIVGKASENWIPKEKKSYWLNFYSPVGNFENLFLLPIVYVIFLPGLLSIILSQGYQKIYGVIISIFPLYVIGYDLIYKIKLKKSKNNVIDNTNFFKSYDILKNTISIMGISIICIFLIFIFFKLPDFISKVIFFPFLGCGLCSFGSIVSRIFQNYRLEKWFLKGYIIIFLIFWFGFLFFWTIGIVKQEGNYLYAIFSIPFWVIGIFIIYKYIIKDK
ncbi:MAG: hypothetical protein E7167_06190 [Firmicutes bacterium]|nr:hypothetical protein [Bacillota bacterium]